MIKRIWGSFENFELRIDIDVDVDVDVDTDGLGRWSVNWSLMSVYWRVFGLLCRQLWPRVTLRKWWDHKYSLSPLCSCLLLMSYLLIFGDLWKLIWRTENFQGQPFCWSSKALGLYKWFYLKTFWLFDFWDVDFNV